MADEDLQQRDPPTSAPRTLLSRVFDELGLASVYHCQHDVKLLCLQRFCRLFAYGGSTLILVAFLQELGFSRTRIGFFMTLTLVGDVVISFVLTLFADAIGRKAILLIGAVLMVASGITFARCADYWVLLAAAIFGVISPSGNEIGPFRAVEESVVAHLTTSATRSDIFAWYTLLGNTGTAFGLIACGWAMRSLVDNWHWAQDDAYRTGFWGYAVCGAIQLCLTLLLSEEVELDKNRASKSLAGSPAQESTPLLPEANDNGAAVYGIAMQKPSKYKQLLAALPQISSESRAVITKICLLFALDSFTSGLVSLSWVTYFFRWKFNLDDGTLGSIFSATSIATAVSILVASSLARRFGNVKTMVFTHLPSSIFLALIPMPENAFLSLVFLFLRDSTRSMDTAPRTTFVSAVLLPEERTAAMGLINVTKTAAQSVGPAITGILADHNLFWLIFVLAAAGKIMYDIGLLILFQNYERGKANRESLEDARQANVESPGHL